MPLIINLYFNFLDPVLLMHVRDDLEETDDSNLMLNNLNATTFRNSNETRWDSTKLMIRSYLNNYGKK